MPFLRVRPLLPLAYGLALPPWAQFPQGAYWPQHPAVLTAHPTTRCIGDFAPGEEEASVHSANSLSSLFCPPLPKGGFPGPLNNSSFLGGWYSPVLGGHQCPQPLTPVKALLWLVEGRRRLKLGIGPAGLGDLRQVTPETWSWPCPQPSPWCLSGGWCPCAAETSQNSA